MWKRMKKRTWGWRCVCASSPCLVSLLVHFPVPNTRRCCCPCPCSCRCHRFIVIVVSVVVVTDVVLAGILEEEQDVTVTLIVTNII
jgi:hypothetical protein